MKQVLILVLCLVACCHGNYASVTLTKLRQILQALNVEEFLSEKGINVQPLFYKYYTDDILPLQFQLWKEHHAKSYVSEEEHDMRLKIWSENVKFIHEHSKLNRSYTVAMNHLGDLTEEEYKGILGTRVNKKVVVTDSGVEGDSWPFDLDWRTKGYVTPVKDQGQCGSCWSFSTTGSIEGLHFKQTAKLVSLSEQNLVDCSVSYGNNGCNGGLMDYAFKYVKENGGIDTEKSYPYTAQDGTCHFNASFVGAKISGFEDVPAGSESALKAALNKAGPVSVAIDAAHQSFQFYSSGIYDEPECSSQFLDHGVLAVGYGREKYVGKPYWIVKNSWSTGWGDKGYIKMIRNKNNQCGIATSASYPV